VPKRRAQTLAGDLLDRPADEFGDKLPVFDAYSYVDHQGNWCIGTTRSKLAWTISALFSTFIVLMGVLVATVGGLVIGTSGHPIIGSLFSLLIVLGAFFHRHTSVGKRVYGVWRGSCPHCNEVLNVSAAQSETKEDLCPTCAHRVLLKDASFKAIPWYGSIFPLK
jgi:hypothetical protein